MDLVGRIAFQAPRIAVIEALRAFGEEDFVAELRPACAPCRA